MGRSSYSDRELVEESLCFSSKNLKEWMNQPYHFKMITWTWSSGRKNSICVQYKPDLNSLELSYTVKNKEKVKYDIQIIQQVCHYGNYRYYFACPVCHKKVYKVYNPPSSKYFACRKCHNLTYNEQKTHNKRFDGFVYNKYYNKINELLSTGKLKDMNKAFKLKQRQTNLFHKNSHKAELLLERNKQKAETLWKKFTR